MKTITIRPTLCAVGFALILSGAVPAVAAANNRNNGNFASGNSAVSQYVESFPTAGGRKPSQRIRPGGHHGKHSASGPLSPSTQRALAQNGQSGQGAAAFANATAPSSSGTGAAGSGASLAGARGAAGAAGANGSGTAHPGAAGSRSGGSVATRVGAVAGATSGGSSPLKSVLTAFTGGSTTGGLGPFLPVLLVVILLGGSAVGFAHRARRRST
jgi:hypothetical protein